MRSVVRHGVLVVVFGSVLGAFVACASNDDGPPLGLEDGTGGGSFDAGVDRGSPLPGEDASAEDASGEDAAQGGFDAATDAHDGGLDATVDADAGDAGPTTRLFYLGDYAVNNAPSIGRALVPMGAAAPATSTIATKAGVYAVTPDGTKIVFSADVTLAGRDDLYVANADGTSPTLLVTMARAGTSVTDILVSPDGMTVAFVADIDSAGQSDVYVVPLAGGAAPVRVSPARAAADAALDAQSIAWSRDSKTLAMAGDFTTDKKNELWVVDVGAATPAPVVALAAADIPLAATGTSGVSTSLRPAWTAAGKVCVKADLVGTPHTYRLYCAGANGAAFGEPTHFPAAPAQLGTYGLSPDGLTLAFAADSSAAPGAYEIYTMPAADSAAPARVTSGTIAAAAGTSRGPSFFLPLVFSPNGATIGFVGDLATDEKFELYVVVAAGGVTEKRITLVGAANDDTRDVTAFAWSPDSRAIAFVGDHRKDNDFELFRTLDVTTADQAPQLVQGVVIGGDVDPANVDWRP